MFTKWTQKPGHLSFAELQALAAVFIPRSGGNMVYIGSHEAADGHRFESAEDGLDIPNGRLAKKRAALTKADGSRTTNPRSRKILRWYGFGREQNDDCWLVLSSPVVVEDAVYFGSTDGNVYALK